MPLYEYHCATCGRFEKIQKFTDKPLKVCPTCKGKQIERVLSPPAIQFKGSGWYVTDYAGKGKSDGKAKDGSAAASGDSSDSSTPKTKSTSEKKEAASSGASSKS